MKTNLRGKIREFIQSEEGKVGVKTPLTLGVAVGSVLLALAVVGPAIANHWECDFNWQCNDDEVCSVGTCV